MHLQTMLQLVNIQLASLPWCYQKVLMGALLSCFYFLAQQPDCCNVIRCFPDYFAIIWDLFTLSMGVSSLNNKT